MVKLNVLFILSIKLDLSCEEAISEIVSSFIFDEVKSGKKNDEEKVEYLGLELEVEVEGVEVVRGMVWDGKGQGGSI